MVGLDDHRLVLLDLELVPNPGAERPARQAAVLDLADRSGGGCRTRGRRFEDPGCAPAACW
jgi:hypothetical protein